ncbi:ABC transporter substrate-binding protein [Ectobacillus ponti]|uniref:Extracellular solute-binding protein n=1 Tax=Ectobacillus ponti TaxID=2961894 RepID=A0AA41X6J9_9BACI|nr:extracellular solute-binding protein [Ectobacillus ponti]MCP8967745.1 extracellular solute-binding protein [Ectobacillus ponti]
MKKKLLAGVSGMMLFAGLLSGCSSSSTSSSSSSSSATDAGKDGKVKITLWDIKDQNDPYIAPIVKDFMKENPDIQVEITPYAVDPLKEALKVAASSNTMPDAWFTWGGTLGSFYPENGLAADLTQVSKDDKWAEKFNKAAIDLSSYSGKVYGVPYHLNSVGMFYNKNVYQKAGLTAAPKTFAEFEEQMQKVKDAGSVPLAVGGKNGWMLMRFTEQLIEHYGGPDLHDKLNSMKASWDDPAVVKTFAKLKEWSDKGYFQKGFISMDPEEAETITYQDKGALVLEGSWYDGTLIAKGYKPENFQFFPFTTEQTPTRMSSFVEMFQVKAGLDKEKQAAVVKLLEYLTDKEVVNKYADKYGAAATLGVTYPASTPHIKEMGEAVAKGNFLIADQALPQEVVQKLFEAQDKVVLGEFSPEQAAKSIQEAVKSYKDSK